MYSEKGVSEFLYSWFERAVSLLYDKAIPVSLSLHLYPLPPLERPETDTPTTNLTLKLLFLR